ncbi:MAG: glycosyltransferase family 4 protein [Calditrichaeota bacterium]|nr:glycosyltransferase family 4 protein [Calditrichota bacterium]
MARGLRLLYLGDPAAIHVQRWLRYFAGAGHKAELLPYPGSFAHVSAASLPGVHLHRPGEGPLRHIVRTWPGLVTKTLIIDNALRVRQLARSGHIDILHAHYLSANGWIGMLSGIRPFVATAWGSDLNVDVHRSLFYSVLTRLCVRRADLLTANSADLCRKLVQAGADERRVHLIQAGLELERFPFKRGDSDLRQALGLQDRPVVLSTRMLGRVYNLDIVLRAVPKVRAAVPDVVFLFAYRGTAEQEQALRALVAELKVQDAVVLLGPVENERIAPLYHVAEVFVSVPSSEGMPGSLTEAMACGAVPVLSDLPYVGEWVRHGENGLVVPVRDVDALAEAIVWLLRHPRQRAAMALRNRSLVEERADHRLWMARVEELYRSLLSSPARSR